MNPGEKRTDGFGNPYVLERKDATNVYVWDRDNKLQTFELAKWITWKLVHAAEQEGLPL